MKIGILTYYGVFNHGAVLQANALKTVLQSMGHTCDFIHYDRNYDMLPQGRSNKYNISLKSLGIYAKYLTKKGVKNTAYNLKKNAVLKQYRQSNLPLGVRYTDFTGDAVVIGSDEVFSFEIGINPFFYGHGLQAGRVVSYAASFGPTTLQKVKERRLDRLVASGLSGMDAVSVRDENSADIVEALTGHKPEIVCDPVILYGYKEEIGQYQPPESNYIIVYSYENNLNTEEEAGQIRAYAAAHGLKIYAAAYYHGWCDKSIQATPNELLGWIKNAALIVTDTFHGAVLALICNTPMIVKLRGNQNKLGYLMHEYELDARVIDNFDAFASVAEQAINFDMVNTIIEQRRTTSMCYLREALDS